MIIVTFTSAFTSSLQHKGLFQHSPPPPMPWVASVLHPASPNPISPAGLVPPNFSCSSWAAIILVWLSICYQFCVWHQLSKPISYSSLSQKYLQLLFFIYFITCLQAVSLWWRRQDFVCLFYVILIRLMLARVLSDALDIGYRMCGSTWVFLSHSTVAGKIVPRRDWTREYEVPGTLTTQPSPPLIHDARVVSLHLIASILLSTPLRALILLLSKSLWGAEFLHQTPKKLL